MEADKIVDYLNSDLLAKIDARKGLPGAFIYDLCSCVRLAVLNGCDSFTYTLGGFSWALLGQQIDNYKWIRQVSGFLAGQRFIRKWIEEDEVLQNLFQLSSVTDTELRYVIDTQKIILPNTLSRLLLDTLNYEGQHQNYTAVVRLKDLKEAEVFQIVLDALQNEETEWRVKAAHALPKAYIMSAQFEYDIISPLTLALEDEASSVRARAAQSLSRFNKPAAIKALFGAIDDVNPDVRAKVVQALGYTGDCRNQNPVLVPDPESSGTFLVRSLGDLAEILSQEIIIKLARMLKEDTSSEVRQQAAWALGWLEKTDLAVSSLIDVLDDLDHLVRLEAAKALGLLADTRSFQPLLSMVINQNENGQVRAEAAYSLGQLKNPLAVEPILKLLVEAEALTDEAELIRERAGSALVSIRQPAVQPIITILNKKNLPIQVRIRLTRILGFFHDQQTVKPFLLKALEDGDSRVRIAAAHGLNYSDYSLRTKDITRLLQSLLEVIKTDQDEQTQIRAVYALSSVSNEKVLNGLKKFFDEEAGLTDPVKEALRLSISSLEQRKKLGL